MINSSNNLFDLRSKKMLLREFSNYSEAKFLNEFPTWPDWNSLRTEWRKQLFFCVLQ